jgi:putative transposase
MKRAHKIRIYPNNTQRTFLEKHCGCARLTYNTCLNRWIEDKKNGIKHNYYSIKKWFNSMKHEEYPFIAEVSKWAPEAAIADLGNAFKRFLKNESEHPVFHKKGIRDSFRIDGSVVKVEDTVLCLPKGLHLRMAEKLRYKPSKIYNITVSKTANRWFVSILCEIPKSENQAVGSVGIDLGISNHAVLSDGKVFENDGLEKSYRRKLARAQRALHRKQKGSKNRQKAQRRLATIYWRMTNARHDRLHKFTTDVSKQYATVCLEDLNVKGMMANHKLARAVADVAFGELKRQFEYKAREVKYVGRFEPTTKPCCFCGKLHDMPLHKRLMNCECGNIMDRDLNAAKNILRLAKPKVKPVEKSKTSLKQESNGKFKLA